MKPETESAAPRIPCERSRRPKLAASWLCLFLLALAVHITSAQAQQEVVLVGSGSTVPARLYNRWAQEYSKRNPKIQMRYVPIGTEEGIKQIAQGSGDFGAGEAPLSEKQKREGLTELPTVLIAIVPVYNLNLPDVHEELHLSGEVLADIFLGNVRTWNAPQIAKLNPGLALPNAAIHVIHRPSGKGSNYIFTDFLAKSSAKFRAHIGVSTSPNWPVGESAERSSDMADKVRGLPGAIGYVEYQYAVKNNLQQASVLSPAGKFVRASEQGFEAACQEVEMPRWRNFSASLVNAHGAESFPITSFTWIYVPTSARDATRAAAFGDLLNWIYSDGQTLALQEGYAPLPAQLVAEVKKKLNERH